jgi:hypothetical protein
MSKIKRLIKNKWLNIIIKTLVLVGASWAFYKQTLDKENFVELWQMFKSQLVDGNVFWLVLAFLLLPITYFFEVWKWQLAIKKIIQPTYTQIIKSILAGTALAFWTPGQIGDYGGRLLFIKTKKKWEVALATAVGNIAQQVAVITLGGIGVYYYLYFYSDIVGVAFWVITGFYSSMLLLMWFIYFKVEVMIPVLKAVRLFNEKNEAALTTLKSFSLSELWTLLFLAAVKLCIYSLQYYCFLRFFGIYGSFLTLYLLVLADYAIQLVLPVPPFLRLILRGEVAIVIWGAFSDNQIAILAASFGVFTLNVLLPSLVGIGFVMSANILKSFNYEDIENA